LLGLAIMLDKVPAAKVVRSGLSIVV
jgi:hypothetical protein